LLLTLVLSVWYFYVVKLSTYIFVSQTPEQPDKAKSIGIWLSATGAAAPLLAVAFKNISQQDLLIIGTIILLISYSVAVGFCIFNRNLLSLKIVLRWFICYWITYILSIVLLIVGIIIMSPLFF